MRLVAYTDYAYHRRDGALYAERAFALFLARVGREFDRVTIIGRLDPGASRGHYRLPAEVEFIALPYYGRLTDVLPAISAMARSLGAFWRALDEADVAWLLGPHPLATAFALLARLRGRRAVLGVREDMPEYVRSRHPQKRVLWTVADLLDLIFRRLARRCPTIVVGPALARRYASAARLLEINVSLVEADDVVEVEQALARAAGNGPRQVLSVGRIEREKNPLLMAEVLGLLQLERPGEWRLTVCGEGPMESDLAARLSELGLADLAELRGYVPLDAGLADLYRESSAFLHVSLTEGLPQVLLEAFAAGTPVVATDVGGIGEAVGDAAVVVPAGDAEAAASALLQISGDPGLRERLIRSGHAYVCEHTLEREAAAVARFLGSTT